MLTWLMRDVHPDLGGVGGALGRYQGHEEVEFLPTVHPGEVSAQGGTMGTCVAVTGVLGAAQVIEVAAEWMPDDLSLCETNTYSDDITYSHQNKHIYYYT
jgi:hypothetical protein